VKVLDEYFEVEMVSQSDGQQRSFSELFSRLNGGTAFTLILFYKVQVNFGCCSVYVFLNIFKVE
jgi:hypothetical protein